MWQHPPRVSFDFEVTYIIFAYRIQAFHNAMEIEPDSWFLMADVGSTYLNLGDDERAEHWYRKALEIAPDGLQQMGTNMARLHLMRDEPESAGEILDEVLAEQLLVLEGNTAAPQNFLSFFR